MHNILAEKVSNLKGVGEKISLALNKAGIFSVFDLLLRSPKAIITHEESLGFKFMQPKRYYVAKGVVKASKVTGFNEKKRLEVILEDNTGFISIVFFGNQVNYVQNKFLPNKEVIISGEAKDFLGRVQMVHPKIIEKELEQKNTQSTYSQINGLMSATFKKIVDKSLLEIKKSNYIDHLDTKILQKYDLANLINSLEQIHNPSDKYSCNFDNKDKCKFFKRIAFEELLAFYIPLFKEQTKNTPSSLVISFPDIKKLASDILPFQLTDGQTKALEDIFTDMSANKPMLRLLQGDVGCGKTAVSAVAAFAVLQVKSQVAFMAPTEILAKQIFAVFQDFFKKNNFAIELLTSSTSSKERTRILNELKIGTTNIIVGTHALLTDDIIFKNLGLFVIDEQHRFGVNQRATLLRNAEKNQGFVPHLLVMSATPIPRSLALTIYHDLDLSIIQQKPKGRLAVDTKIFASAINASLHKICERIIASKQKAFIVFPLVEESEALDLQNAKNAYLEIINIFGADKVLMVHGKMKPKEKDLAMQNFKDSTANLLVATSVIEVGVDIPNATVMIIVHPERFGIAQLHQLRGRVGRGDAQSYCFLLTEVTNKFSSSYKRLESLCKTQDGFKLAQIDLEQRGPGELLGVKQSGLPNFHIFNHTDFAQLVEPAKFYAKKIATQNEQPIYQHLIKKIDFF